MKKVAVIGGGASGMIAACFAAEHGADVTLFEKQNKLGRKVLVTGNGRCNICNRHLTVDRYHGRDVRFASRTFDSFGVDETINFFRSIGLPLVEEEGGRMYPQSLQSSSVVRLFEYELERRGVQIFLHRRIDTIKPEKNGGFQVVTAGREKHAFESIILAPGSCAFSPAGASSIGYELAESLGHRVSQLFPAIVPINIPERQLHRLQGTKVNCSAKVRLDGTFIDGSEGELLFTGYGISGPVSLDLSRCLNEKVTGGKFPEIVIDFFPAYSTEHFRELLESLWTDSGKSISMSLMGIMRNTLPDLLCMRAGLNPHAMVNTLDDNDKKNLVTACKELVVHPGDPRGFAEAVVAAGGADVGDVDVKTMESKIVAGLYLTGEILDIDGDSGGFNLQFAWSSGAIAGMSQ